MVYSEESNRTFRLQNNTVYEPQSVQFITTFKHELGKKVKTQVSYVSTKLQMNYKTALIKVVRTCFCKMYFKYFGNSKNLKFCTHIFLCILRAFAYMIRTEKQACTHIFKHAKVAKEKSDEREVKVYNTN